MLARLAVEERGEEQRVGEAGIAAAARCPGTERLVAARERAADRREALGVGVEDPPRPVGRGHRAGDEVGRRDRALLDERLLLRGERERRLLALAPVDDHGQPPLVDPRPHLDRQLERRRADLGEPEAVLLDEVEGEPVGAGRLRDGELQLELGGLAGLDRMRERCAQAVPDDRVAAVVEPVVGELDARVAP